MNSIYHPKLIRKYIYIYNKILKFFLQHKTNVTLCYIAGDDGFGDVPSMDPRTPEMLRDASEMENDFGGDTLSLAQEVGF